MIKFLKFIILPVLLLLKTKYSIMVVLFAAWYYRVAYMPADSAGFAKTLQVVTLSGMLILLVNYSKKWSYPFKVRDNAIRFLILLYVWATLSFLWSPLPQFAFFLGFQNVVMILVIYWLLSMAKDYEDMEHKLLTGGLFIVVADSVLLRILYEHGLFVHHLDAASSSALLMCYCVGEYVNAEKKDIERKSLLRMSMIICAIIVIFGTSSGANASAIFGIGIALFFSRRWYYGIPLVMGAIFLLLYQEYVDDLIFFIMPGKTEESLATATGRQQLWDAMLEITQERPWIGWGFGCVERIVWEEGMISFPVPDAHSNFVGLYGSLGYVGCFLALVHFTYLMLGCFKRRHIKGYLGVFAAGSCALMNGYTYGFLASKACTITLIYFALVFMFYFNRRFQKYAAIGHK